LSHVTVRQDWNTRLGNRLFGPLLVVGFAAFFWPRLLWISQLWVSDGFYSFSVLVPIVSIGIIFLKRAKLKELPHNPSKTGVLIVVAAVSLTILLDGSGLSLKSATPVLILSSVAGTAWAVGGMAMLRTLSFPLGFLLFLVPVPPVVVATVDYPLQELCARVTATLAQMSGIDARQVGAMVYLPNFTMGIAPACNGLRSSIAMLALGVLYVYLVEGPLSRKLLLVVFAIPLAYLANFVRLFSDVFVVNALGSRFLPYEAAYDYVWGFLVFLLAVILFFTLAHLLRCKKFRAIS